MIETLRDVVVSDPSGRDLGATTAYELDMSIGDTGNNFELSAPGMPISQGCLVSIDGTEYGGVVDSAELVGEGGTSTVTWSGRTWTGVLLGRVLSPDAGRDYLDVAGEANAVLSQLVARMGLSGLFQVPAEDSGVRVQHRFERFTDGYTGMRRMLAASSAKLVIRRVDGSTVLRAAPARAAGGGVDSDLIDFTARRDWRPVNHLVCAGTGELASRKVVHLYADASGAVSRRQTLFGVDEVAELYDYSNADEQKLIEDGTRKLRGYQTGGAVDVTVRGGLELDVGDTVTGEVRGGGVPDSTVTAAVVKKVVRASGGALAVSYEVGNPQTSATGGISGRAESSGGGASYAAGEGISISGGVISASVRPSDLEGLRSDVSSARADASNALAAVGGAERAAEEARAAADAAQATADARLAPESVRAVGPLGATASGGSVTVSHGRAELSEGSIDKAVGLNDAPPGFGGSVSVPALAIDALGHVIGAKDVRVQIPSSAATASAPGLMSAADKAKLDGVAAGANRYTLPTASRYTLGGVRVDGSTISASNGVISVVPGAGGGGITALDAWPVGSIYQSTRPTNPAQLFGGTWAEMPSLGPYTWERIA